jgi:plastocyanin
MRANQEIRPMYRTLSNTLRILLATGAFVACSDSVGPKANATLSIQDQCDPASFNAALGAGTCTKQGIVTFSQFNAELNSTHQVAAWQFVPTSLAIRIGQSIAATNNGGEVHTFTEVAAFGGGIVPTLNQASGNTVEAAECKTLTAADMVMPGATFTTTPETNAGTELYQCCIHPWMRTVVKSS